MFNQTDLRALVSERDTVTVSIFVPTAVSGDQTLQGRIHLKNAIAKATRLLESESLDSEAVEQLLAPAEALLHDAEFWQHQREGLALFLAPGDPMRHFRVPILFPEDVVVAETFFVTPLLPLLSADGSFTVVALTADNVRLFSASRFALEEVLDSGLPTSIEASMVDSDYENPLQASPVARPHTGNFSISNAQVYGDSPSEWRSARTAEFANRVAAALRTYRASRPEPTVLVANTEFIGLLGAADVITDSVDLNPGALDEQALHAAAYDKVRPRLDATSQKAIDSFTVLHGRADPRAASGVEAVAAASADGRVETIFYRHETVEDPALRELINSAVVDAVRHGGVAYAIGGELDTVAPVCAVLRY